MRNPRAQNVVVMATIEVSPLRVGEQMIVTIRLHPYGPRTSIGGIKLEPSRHGQETAHEVISKE